MDKKLSVAAEFSQGLVHGLMWSVIVVAALTIALLVVAEQRDKLADELQLERARLEEARGLCRAHEL